MKQVLREHFRTWYFMEIQYSRKEKKYIYIQRNIILPFNHQSAFFWKTITWLAQAMMLKYMELLGDTTDWKMIKTKKNAKKYLRKKEKKRRKEKKKKKKRREEKKVEEKE